MKQSFLCFQSRIQTDEAPTTRFIPQYIEALMVDKKIIFEL